MDFKGNEAGYHGCPHLWKCPRSEHEGHEGGGELTVLSRILYIINFQGLGVLYYILKDIEDMGNFRTSTVHFVFGIIYNAVHSLTSQY